MSQDEKENIKQELNKAINFLGQNKFTEAENTCLKIIESGDNADAYHILSSIKIYQQEFEESIKYVIKSIDIDNSNPGYHVTLGCAYSSMKDYKNSISAFENAIKLNDNVAQVHFYLGESLRKLKKYNESGKNSDYPKKSLEDKVKKGELGVKTGKGFYDYKEK